MPSTSSADFDVNSMSDSTNASLSRDRTTVLYKIIFCTPRGLTDVLYDIKQRTVFQCLPTQPRLSFITSTNIYSVTLSTCHPADMVTFSLRPNKNYLYRNMHNTGVVEFFYTDIFINKIGIWSHEVILSETA